MGWLQRIILFKNRWRIENRRFLIKSSNRTAIGLFVGFVWLARVVFVNFFGSVRIFIKRNNIIHYTGTLDFPLILKRKHEDSWRFQRPASRNLLTLYTPHEGFWYAPVDVILLETSIYHLHSVYRVSRWGLSIVDFHCAKTANIIQLWEILMLL